MVFQRDKSNLATVNIGGYVQECVSRVEARFVPIKSNPSRPELGTPAPIGGGWEIIKNTSTCGNFSASMPVRGGWYRLEIRGIKDGHNPVEAAVAHVGVGEVFLVAGQSNASGGDSNPSGPGAVEDAVSSIDFRNQNNDSYSNLQLPCPEYVHLDKSTKTAPFGNYAWCWGLFGDKLVQKLNVPVMIFNAGWSATGMLNWKESIPTNGITTAWFGANYPAGLPFGHLRIALNNYIAQLGIRAVLWHQGETDNLVGNSRELYRDALRTVINESRNLTGKPKLNWLVSRASRYSYVKAPETKKNTHVSAAVIAAQNDVIGLGTQGSDPNYKLNDVFPGPETDPYWDVRYRHDSVHFSGNGQSFLAQLWVDHIGTDFLANSTPYPAIVPAAIEISQTNSTSLTFTAADGWDKYNWLSVSNCNTSLSSTPEWTAGMGLYKLKTTDLKNNTVFSPALYVSGTSLPVTWEYFTGLTNNLSVTLRWATAQETNAGYYELQRSIDVFNFETVAIVDAIGDTHSTSKYDYHDAVPQSGTYYYRLKQVDKDGKFAYSRIISFHLQGRGLFNVFPNPVVEMLNIESETMINSVEIVDSNGAISTPHFIPSNHIQLDMNSFPRGLYIIRLNGASFKIVK